uniref:Choline/ethanolaminephosphotransferase 1 n=1 Tax=Lygus hesperus TaxID=30085 RepID=A0A0A9X3L2_LYGHE
MLCSNNALLLCPLASIRFWDTALWENRCDRSSIHDRWHPHGFCDLWNQCMGHQDPSIDFIEFRHSLLVMTLFGGSLALYELFLLLCKGGVGKNGSTVAGTSVLSPVIPLSLVVVPAYIIYRKSTNLLYENNPVLYIMSFGLVGAKVTNRLVVAHMTRNEMDYLDSSLVGPLMLFLNQYFNFFFDEYYVLWISLIWVSIDLFRYSSQVCIEICDHMHIMLFRITPSTIPQATTNKNGTSSVTNFRQTRSRKHYH